MERQGGMSPQAGGSATERLRSASLVITPASWAVLFGGIVVALVSRNVLVAGRRPLGWAVAAMIAAAAAEPLVSVVSRHVRRGVALPLVIIPVLAGIGFVTWGVVSDLDVQVARLQKAIPEAAQEIERTDRFGDAAKEFDLVAKADDLASRLNPPSKQVSQEAAGGLSGWFLTLILTVFALGYGPRFSKAGLEQIRDPERRDRIGHVVGRAFHHSQVYVDTSVLLAVATGVAAWGAFTLFDLPAPTPLALVVAVASLVPSFGLFVAALPAAVLAGASGDTGTAVAIVVGAAVLQAAHRWVIRRVTDRDSRPGAATIVIPFLVGFDLYGTGGAVVAMALAVFASCLLDSLAVQEDAEREAAAPSPAAGSA